MHSLSTVCSDLVGQKTSGKTTLLCNLIILLKYQQDYDVCQSTQIVRVLTKNVTQNDCKFYNILAILFPFLKCI